MKNNKEKASCCSGLPSCDMCYRGLCECKKCGGCSCHCECFSMGENKMRKDDYKKINEMNKKKDGEFFKHFNKELDVDLTKERKKIEEMRKHKQGIVETFRFVFRVEDVRNGKI